MADVGEGDVYYQSSDRHSQSVAIDWIIYDPNDLAAVAFGQKQQWQIQPKHVWTDPGNIPFTSAKGTPYIGGAVFDPTTNRLYVLVEAVDSNCWNPGRECIVYQVGAPGSTPSAAIPPSAASMTASSTSVNTGITVSFMGSVTTGTTPITYSWSFGDNTTGSGASVSHAYSAAGNYTVTLTASNTAGSATATKAITVTSTVAAPSGVSITGIACGQ